MEKYLGRYAEPEIDALDSFFDHRRWADVVVIPASNETTVFLRPPPDGEGRCLMILVINETVAAAARVSVNNSHLEKTVRERLELQWEAAAEFPEFGISLLHDPHSRRDILLVDRYNAGRKFALKSGVGLARKIGADLAAALIHRGCIESPWIHCTDADVALPASYFSCTQKLKTPASSIAALVYPFQHVENLGQADSDAVMLATRLYEFSLRYYRAGLRFANSPYAFHTIGSTMAVNAVHYARVRGFPKRAAGEDFYLLNKLAKVGSVQELEEGPGCQPIRIAARRSDRVPFGTGAAVGKIADLDDPVNEFRFYDPAVFALLRCWLQSLPDLWSSGCETLDADLIKVPSSGADPGRQAGSLLACLDGIGVNQALGHAFRQSKNYDQFQRQLQTWFDAFRTLKLIHALRDDHLPSITYANLETHPVFAEILSRDAELQSFRHCLRGFIY